ncbi:hypothetical protein [Pseudoalteromonas sp. TB64]|uniref:hypothetical protein n=1 Tax=Pseudoalteromonas sp. TB64 TaxID=1938600 RepID=UPI0004081848|nr:hypothetical protein [Pseudoalteromonas sp. TB64]
MEVLKAVLWVVFFDIQTLLTSNTTHRRMLYSVDNKPFVIHFKNEAVQAGIKKIILVAHALKNHFNTSFELKTHTKSSLFLKVGSIVPRNMTIIPVRQIMYRFVNLTARKS